MWQRACPEPAKYTIERSQYVYSPNVLEAVPMATDADGSVSDQYGVLRWAVATGELGHTFVLVDRAGEVAWIRDYGAPENGGVMYVPPSDLVAQIRTHLPKKKKRAREPNLRLSLAPLVEPLQRAIKT